jgi:hypothetical protein
VATDDEILLDAFVRVSPDPEFLSAVDKVADDAIKRITEKFASVTIPGPRISDGSGAAGAVQQQISQLATLNSQQQAAEQRREQASQRLLDLQREIENLQGRGRTTFTPASRERAIQAEVRATEELQRAQREYARLLSANDPSVSSEDAAIQKQIVEYQKERNQAEKDYRQSIIDVEQAQLKAARFEKPSRSKFTAEAVAAAQAERDRIAASGAGAVEIAAAELRLEEIRTKFAASQQKRTKDAQKAQDDLQAAILRSTEAEARRVTLSAEIVTDTDALAKARIAAEQRVAEASERVAAARAAVNRQDEGAQRYTETRATRLAAAQNELVSATQAEADARQQVLNINEQILATTRAQQAAEAAVTAELQRQAQANESSKSSSGNAPSAAPDLESSRTSLIAQNLAESNRLADELVAAEQRVSEAAQRVAAARSAIPNAVSPEPREAGLSDPAVRKAEGLEGEVKAQTELVSAIQAEADAQQQALNIKEQIIATAQAHRAAEAAITEELQRQVQASSAAGSAGANPPPGQPPVPGDSGQPPRRRGRGRRGQTPPPPPDPPTTPPDDDGEADELARAYRNATRQVQDLIREISRLNQIKPEINTQETKEDLRILKTAVEDIRIALSRSGEDNDPFRIEQAISRLPDLQGRLDQVSRRISAARAIREEFDDVAFSAKNDITEGRRIAGRTRSLNPGIVSGQDREDLIVFTDAIRQQEEAVKRLSAAFDGTQESVNRLRLAQQDLNDSQQKLAEKEDLIAQTRGRSFNTLSNNAYQLGQAFEDFAVGFSLNGLAGGIRGAANNIAFILNDISRQESTQKLLGERLAQNLPLIAGIGSALAITVLPKLVDWLESLNDIEVQFKDIATQIREDFEDLDFDINFRVSNDQFRRTVSDASSVKDILEQIRDIDFDVDSKRKQLQEIFAGFGALQLFDDENSPLQKIEDQLSQLDNAVKEQLKRTQEQVDSQNSNFFARGARNLGANTFRLFGAETFQDELLALEGFKDEVFNVQRSVQNIVDAGNAGVADPDLIVRAQRQIAQFSEFLASNVNRIDISGDAAKAAETISESLKVFSDRLKEAEAIARKTANAVGKQLEIAIEGAIAKTNELADRQLLIRRRIQGTVDEQAEFLADVRETSAEYAKLIDQVAKFYSSEGKDPAPLVEQLRNQEVFRSENEVLEDQEKLIDDIRKAEDRLAELRQKNAEKARKSQFTNFEDFAKNLQTNVLSIDPIEKNTNAIDELSNEVRILNFRLAQRNATLDNLPRQFTDPQGFQERQRAIEFARPFDVNQALAQMFDRTGLMAGANQAIERVQTPEFKAQDVQGNEIANAVKRGVEDAMRGFAKPIVNEQKNTTDAVKKIGGARVQ